ncbi:ribose-phosphate pyrophosphokinase [Spiroplasma endosymbiont of Nebria brevicollis]|uniref:ribose-phosphate diphosphokinase n=1 Tax=Spiroplasma endosymbiont of Nebria brevicollis TaxID=3066284 RepID=UPI00313E68BC
MNNKDNIIVFGLSASQKFTQEVCKKLGINPGKVEVSRFADGEFNIQSITSVRGKVVYIIQSTSPPTNDNLMELLIFIDVCVRASAEKIHAVIPYFGYARQDRKQGGRQPITCKLVANMLTVAGVNRVITVDLHSPQEQGFFDVPMDDLRATQDLASYLIDESLTDLVVVSPDHGGVTRARRLANYLSAPLAIIDKRRSQPNKSEVKFVLGDVKDKNAIIIDDMIDTGGTIINAAKAIKEHGAKSVYILATHGIFSGEASAKLKQAFEEDIVKEVVITNTIEITPERNFAGLKVISIADFIAKMIDASVNNKSLTKVYDDKTNELIKKINKK